MTWGVSTAPTYAEVMDALMTQLTANLGPLFQTYGRRLRTWQELNQLMTTAGGVGVKQPALYLYDGPGLGGGFTTYQPRQRGTPNVRIMKRTIVIYARMPGAGTPGGVDQEAIGADELTQLVERVESVFNQDDSGQGAFTLGGRVSHCWIEGDGVIIPGDIDPDGQGMATLPVSIMIP